MILHDHVLDIKSVNTLGRKNLSISNPILGTDLNKTTKNVDEDEYYGKEQWHLIEYTTEPKDYDIHKIPKNKDLPIANNNQTLLATPRYIRAINNLRMQAQHENQTQPEEEIYQPNDNLINIYDENIEYIYYAYIDYDNNIIEIKRFTEDNIVNDYHILCGPFTDIDLLKENLYNYLNINNYTYTEISEMIWQIEPILVNNYENFI